MAHEKKGHLRMLLICLETWQLMKILPVALPLLTSMCQIYSPCTIDYLSIDLIFLGSGTMVCSSGRRSWGIMLDSVFLAGGPTSGQLSAPWVILLCHHG